MPNNFIKPRALAIEALTIWRNDRAYAPAHLTLMTRDPAEGIAMLFGLLDLAARLGCDLAQANGVTEAACLSWVQAHLQRIALEPPT
ncbi:hypothetical protein ACPCSC_30730 [Streptomyces lavendulocolor]|uniref:hypothetical protein n=1 Tax=Streptomyces lavendulocolor TaxID=67316 RepID=UPI003C2BD064